MYTKESEWKNKVILGDNVKTMNKLPSESVDLIVTSPPYDDLRDYGGNGWDFTKFKEVSKAMTRVLKPGGTIVWVVGDAVIKGSETGSSFRQALYFKDECGLNIHDTMIYLKNSFSFPSKGRYHQVFEYMFVFTKGKPKTFNAIEDRRNKWFGKARWGKKTARGKDGILKSDGTEKDSVSKKEYGARHNVWLYSTGGNVSTSDKVAFNHPAIFPDKLAEDHILSWSNEGDVVLDPFAGSGTTLKMSLMNNRNFVGCEFFEDYLKIAQERIKLGYEQKEKYLNNKNEKNYLKNKLKDLNKEKEELELKIEEMQKKIKELE